MKKFLCLLLVALMIVPCAFADTDYSKLSDKELLDVINAARNELNRRVTVAEKNKYLLKDSDIEIYFTGSGRSGSYNSGKKFFEIEIVVVNKSNKAIGISFDSICINGWETTTALSQISSTMPGKKRKDYIPLVYSDADLETYKKMEDIELYFHTFDENYNKVKEYGPVVFDFNGKAWK